MKVLSVIGTRPEAIKLAILYKLMTNNDFFNCILCHTGQHTSLVDSVFREFGIEADICLNLPSIETDELVNKMSWMLKSLNTIMKFHSPDLVIVQGDTLSAYCAAMAAYLNKIKLAHVEAGLRTYRKYHPFPEEVLRSSIDKIAHFHFAPSKLAVTHLINEGCPEENIYLTGNTGVDAFLYAKRQGQLKEGALSDIMRFLEWKRSEGRNVLLLTMHRRENHGVFMHNVFCELTKYINRKDAAIICYKHPHPNLAAFYNTKERHDNICYADPLPYSSFIHLLEQVDLILTDSGGLQEEAAYIPKPVIVLREATERQEVLLSNALLVNQKSKLIISIHEMLDKKISVSDAYGSGEASQRIMEILKKVL